MKFDELPTQETPTEKASPKTEENIEAKEGIIEKAKNERLELAFSVFTRLVKLGSHAIDVLPIGNLKMIPEMIMGMTATGKKLNKKDRIMYGLIILHSSIYTTLLGYGVLKGDVNAVILSVPVYAITVGLTIKQKGSQIKEDIPEFIKKYGEELNESLLESKKIIEKYGRENIEKLINKVKQDKKLDDDK